MYTLKQKHAHTSLRTHVHNRATKRSFEKRIPIYTYTYTSSYPCTNAKKHTVESMIKTRMRSCRRHRCKRRAWIIRSELCVRLPTCAAVAGGAAANCIYTYIHVCVQTYIQTCMHTYKDITVHVHSLYICKHIYTRTFTCINIRVYLHRYTHKYIHLHVYTVTETRTRTYSTQPTWR